MSNRAFLVSLALAVSALAIGGVITTLLYLASSPLLDRLAAQTSRENVRPWAFDGKDLLARMGQGTLEASGSLRITGLESGVDERAIFSRRTRLQAADYPFLESEIADRHPGTHMYFIWRTERAPQEVFYQPIHWTGDAPQLQLLADHKEWRGTISEIGLDVYGDLREQGPLVKSLTLLPSSKHNLLSSIWTEWTAFRGWTQKSAHHLRGTPSQPILSPTLATAAWSASAIALLVVAGLVWRRHNKLAWLIAVIIPWVALDMLWQKNLNTQLDETRYLFAGKTQHEKHLADRESELYILAQHLKNTVLPAPGTARVFLLHKGELRGYRRLRMQQYLLPHNVFNFDRYPRPEALMDGDLILVLEDIDGLSFDSQLSTLKWRGQSLPVTRVDESSLGTLYRYGELK